MKEFFADKVRSEEGAETVEIIIGIVVFVVFGIAVFGMITNVAGNKMADVSNCLGNSSNILEASSDLTKGDAKNTCKEYNNADGQWAKYNSNSTSAKPKA